MGKKLYLVHWEGYAITDRTWEPKENLVGAEKALEAFHNSQIEQIKMLKWSENLLSEAEGPKNRKNRNKEPCLC